MENNNVIDKKIIEFIKKHHVLTLATCVNNIPWTSNCFYAYMENEAMFVFTSDDTTRHAQEAMANETVAGSVVLETSIVGKIQGIQFAGRMFKPEGTIETIANKAYMKRFPFAQLMKTNIWCLEMNFIKLTDNRLGFGKKIIWKK